MSTADELDVIQKWHVIVCPNISEHNRSPPTVDSYVKY